MGAANPIARHHQRDISSPNIPLRRSSLRLFSLGGGAAPFTRRVAHKAGNSQDARKRRPPFFGWAAHSTTAA